LVSIAFWFAGDLFLSATIIFALPPKLKPSSFQQEMTTYIYRWPQHMSMEAMANQFAGFQEMMKTTRDTLSDLEAWCTITETSMMQQ
jgi:hypothetical protein